MNIFHKLVFKTLILSSSIEGFYVLCDAHLRHILCRIFIIVCSVALVSFKINKLTSAANAHTYMYII